MLVLKAIWNSFKEFLVEILVVIADLVIGFMGIVLCGVLIVLIIEALYFVATLVFGSEAVSVGLIWLGDAALYILGGGMALLLLMMVVDHIYTEYKILKNKEEKKQLEQETESSKDGEQNGG